MLISTLNDMIIWYLINQFSPRVLPYHRLKQNFETPLGFYLAAVVWVFLNTIKTELMKIDIDLGSEVVNCYFQYTYYI